MNLNQITTKKFQKSIGECTTKEIYLSICEGLNQQMKNTPIQNKKKKLYYICAEFLIGKLLVNNLINTGLYDKVKSELESHGKSIFDIEAFEPEPSLGNGGLGRLASCYLDSVASLGFDGDGMGILYHFGLFKQQIENNKQKEYPDKWLDYTGSVIKTDRTYMVEFPGCDVISVLNRIPVAGYKGKVNYLNLFDVKTADESVVTDGINFDKTDIKKTLTLFLYPDDSTQEGKALRLYQQYFMVSSSAQMIIDECVERGSRLYDLDEYAVIQLNDTHPTLIIPELIRILTDRGIDIENAIQIVTKCCAYTNHTILAEALEKWDIALMQKVVPKLVDIIKVLDQNVSKKYKDKSVHIIENNVVRMAYLAIHYSFCVNGVAKLHTEILKNNELNNFYKIYPDKFQNVTNGITFRRWLLKCNPLLYKTISEYTKSDVAKDYQSIENLMEYKHDLQLIDKLINIKKNAKNNLCEYALKYFEFVIDRNSIFDVQIKRLHEYKRQQLNALYIINKYLDIKQGKIPQTPVTFMFGAKAAPSYTIAKDIIHLINCLGKIINTDKDVNKYIKVFFFPNYNVTLAEKLIPACDISEQISLASKEASGTGNMKFMLNGAVTLGTEDGANVEIKNLVGDNNIYIFGEKSHNVISKYKDASYNSKDIYTKNPNAKRCVDFIVSQDMLEVGDKDSLYRIYNELINKDWFMTLLDFDDYVLVKDKAFCDYQNRVEWGKKMLTNIAKSGFFSSDRAILEYNTKIWKI